ncbi:MULTISPECIES: hypothetical protein [unclassified Streptomyces]|uniref:hypothetical protein n=1 Tax=unclassified Streptomyces TaxID=2593676 RepID=UPI002DDB36D1|nr:MULTISPECIES: hypothetical protein [unclassified Streptomyces]WSA90675.1 hypothetical protein OIE63_03355 [Streptomyces sp. NBC_01795]WSB75000.1 hypothetical protein OHB04_03860 [Streptomyces sp. NBC_01775]WSS16721.1 hypothetical protein OG533_36055 [Streptomyces sp. NBC_01186]WSS45539.1 hypothetical protein OG220_36740 [Streptomyces sp. NBC_01187]
MRHGRLATGTALSIGAAVAGTLALAPSAYAVEPQTATISFDCGTWGSGEATLDATQDGTAATITVTTDAITSPIDVAAGSVSSTLTLSKNETGTTQFTGSANPALPAGSPVSTGPLDGTVASGDALEAQSLTITVLGVTVTCDATSPQTPGPFVFD